MSKKDKLLKKFLSFPADFSFAELMRLMKWLGYNETQSGKISGSAVAFINKKTKHIIKIHKPHPKSELKGYQIRDIIEELRRKKVIK